MKLLEAIEKSPLNQARTTRYVGHYEKCDPYYARVEPSGAMMLVDAGAVLGTDFEPIYIQGKGEQDMKSSMIGWLQKIVQDTVQTEWNGGVKIAYNPNEKFFQAQAAFAGGSHTGRGDTVEEALQNMIKEYIEKRIDPTTCLRSTCCGVLGCSAVVSFKDNGRCIFANGPFCEHPRALL